MNYNTKTDVNESQFDDVREYYDIKDKKDIYKLLGDVIVLNRYKNNIDYLYERTVDVASLCWNNKDEKGNKLQHTIIKFKVDVDDDIVYALPLNRFMLSLTFLKPLMEFIDVICVGDYIVSESLTHNVRCRIQSALAKTLMGFGFPIKEVQELLAVNSLDLKELLLVFAEADMKVLTAENLFLDHYKESEIIRDINNTNYPTSMQTAEIVEENNKRYSILKQEMLRLGNPFFEFDKYARILNQKQMEELYINFSQIPDGKNIVPVIMNGNGFKAGYHDKDVMYAAAIAARVPDIMTEDYMGETGYFARNLWILTYGTISKTVYDCGSTNTLDMYMDDEAMLAMYDGRYYYDTPDRGVLKVLDKNDKSLLGRTLYFRSPCKCNLNEDKCHVCYGSKALKVGSLKGGFVYTTEIMTGIIENNVLSVKHILKANAVRINYSPNFEKYFTLDSSVVMPLDKKKVDIYLTQDYADNLSEQFKFYIGKNLEEVTISDYASIHVPDEVIDTAKQVTIDEVPYYKISSYKVIETGGTFASVTPINLMTTAQYLNIKRMFENDIRNYGEKIEDAVTALVKASAGLLPLYATHLEVIVSHLLMSVDNKLLRPDWTVPNQEYQIMCLKTALMNTESVTKALAFQQTRHHLLNRIFDERNEIKRVGPRSFEDFAFGEEYL